MIVIPEFSPDTVNTTVFYRMVLVPTRVAVFCNVAVSLAFKAFRQFNKVFHSAGVPVNVYMAFACQIFLNRWMYLLLTPELLVVKLRPLWVPVIGAMSLIVPGSGTLTRLKSHALTC
jgi:hypothetical protein